jgi:hypothetical protein
MFYSRLTFCIWSKIVLRSLCKMYNLIAFPFVGKALMCRGRGRVWFLWHKPRALCWYSYIYTRKIDRPRKAASPWLVQFVESLSSCSNKWSCCARGLAIWTRDSFMVVTRPRDFVDKYYLAWFGVGKFPTCVRHFCDPINPWKCAQYLVHWYEDKHGLNN